MKYSVVVQARITGVDRMAKKLDEHMEPHCWSMVYSGIRLLYYALDETRHDNRYTREIRKISKELEKVYQEGY
jgi:hypothetical protein